MGDALASLASFLYAESEMLDHGRSEDPIFPDATPELIAFLEMYAEDVCIAGADWEEAPNRT